MSNTTYLLQIIDLDIVSSLPLRMEETSLLPREHGCLPQAYYPWIVAISDDIMCDVTFAFSMNFKMKVRYLV